LTLHRRQDENVPRTGAQLDGAISPCSTSSRPDK
jgi:hypothetical protein